MANNTYDAVDDAILILKKQFALTDLQREGAADAVVADRLTLLMT